MKEKVSIKEKWNKLIKILLKIIYYVILTIVTKEYLDSGRYWLGDIDEYMLLILLGLYLVPNLLESEYNNDRLLGRCILAGIPLKVFLADSGFLICYLVWYYLTMKDTEEKPKKVWYRTLMSILFWSIVAWFYYLIIGLSFMVGAVMSFGLLLLPALYILILPIRIYLSKVDTEKKQLIVTLIYVLWFLLLQGVGLIFGLIFSKIINIKETKKRLNALKMYNIALLICLIIRMNLYRIIF